MSSRAPRRPRKRPGEAQGLRRFREGAVRNGCSCLRKAPAAPAGRRVLPHPPVRRPRQAPPVVRCRPPAQLPCPRRPGRGARLRRPRRSRKPLPMPPAFDIEALVLARLLENSTQRANPGVDRGKATRGPGAAACSPKTPLQVSGTVFQHPVMDQVQGPGRRAPPLDRA